MIKIKTQTPLRESVASQIEDLRQLKDGWFEGKGQAPTQTGLDWILKQFESFLSENETQPYIYPTFEGGLRAEWPVKNWELSLEINLEARSGFWHAYNIDNESDEEKMLDLNMQTDWEWVSKELVSKEED